MKIFVTGATGFIGQALVERWKGTRQVVAWTRSPDAARARLGSQVEVAAATDLEDALARAIEGCDAIVNLAGESIVGRWSDEKKNAMVKSRVELTEAIVRAMSWVNTPPRVLVSGSAVGYYGDRGDELLTEDSAPGTDFLADLCVRWEGAAQGARAQSARVVTLRTGVVLHPEGGALAQMLTPFKLGVGGKIGSGRQYMPWIHRTDLLRLIDAALTDERYEAPINGTAPNPVTNADFTKALGRALHRPTFLPMPGAAVSLMFGEGASILLGGQRVLPARPESLGFRFDYPELDGALKALLG